MYRRIAALIGAGLIFLIASFPCAAEPPNNAAVRMNLGLAYYKSGRITEAAGQFSKIHSADPSNRQATLLLANAYLSSGQNTINVDIASCAHGDHAVAQCPKTRHVRRQPAW